MFRSFLIAIVSLVLFSCSPKNKPNEYVLGHQVGNLAPNLKGPSPTGDTLSLYDLRGRYVLLDFWASWCRPCRWDNRHLIQTVDEYKDQNFPAGTNWRGKPQYQKGFSVFSVSLDRAKQSWVNAIRQDKLDWPWHISDLKYWNSELAQQYRISAIPSNFLINPEGIIIGKNLRGNALKEALEAIVNPAKPSKK